MQKILKSIESSIKEYYRNVNKNNYSHQKLSLSEPIFNHLEANELIKSFLQSKISQGNNVERFEKLFAKRIGTKYAIATNSGSSANLIALNSIKNIFKLKEGDEVIVPASTFATVVMPIIQLGLKPVYVDVDIDTLNISLNEIKKAITKKTKIIMPVHTLGLPCEIDKIISFAKKNNLIVFEDCCEAHGASLNKKFVGSFGTISAFSFYVAHNITCGEGGMILTNNKNIFYECRSLREFGRIEQKDIKKRRYYSDKIIKDYDKRYIFTKIGYNMRMSDLHASIGIHQVKKLTKLNNLRVNNANYLYKEIKNGFLNHHLRLPIKNKKYFNSYYTFPIILKNKNIRRGLCEYLERSGIQTRPMMGGCLPDQPAFRKAPGRIFGKLINSRVIRDQCFFIGIHPGINKKNLDYFLKKLTNFFL
jgi:CDP-6-deoxy-D-xylo-4-hexulose-3-dehydrase